MNKHLRTLEILHYVYGAFVCVTGLALVFVIGAGMLMQSDWMAGNSQEELPNWLGGFISTLGTVILVVVELVGLLNIYSGWSIGRRRNRTFSMVVSAVDCLSIPFGLLLGVFTLIGLSEESVKQEYEGNVAQA